MQRIGLALSGLFLAAMPVLADDMRACRLDALSFIDPWGGGRFDVTRAGRTEPYYLCDNAVVGEAQADPDRCRGPFGSTVLEGRLAPYGSESVPAVAIYSVIPGAPCCGWEVMSPEEAAEKDPVEWFAPGEAPVLGTRPFASIDEAWGSLGPGLNPMMALVCAHDLP